MVDIIVSSLYPSVAFPCTILAIANLDTVPLRDMFESLQERHAMVSVTEDYVVRDSEHLSSFLRQQTGCAVGAFVGKDLILKEVVHALRKVNSHVILKLDELKPKISTLVSSEYPVVWTEKVDDTDGKDTNLLNLYCPKEDKLKGTVSKFSLANLSKVNCPHYLQDQDLGLGHIPHGIKRMINGAPVYGDNYVRFFEYVSEKFKFRPWFRLGRVLYYSKNATWGGLQAQVG